MNRRPEGGYQPAPGSGLLGKPPASPGSASDVGQKVLASADVEEIRAITEQAVDKLISDTMREITEAARQGKSEIHIRLMRVSQEHKNRIEKHFTEMGFKVSKSGPGPWHPATIIRWTV